MQSDTDRALENAYELGRKNAQIIELARRHCVNMEFHESGGRGLAEEASGLPINMRRVHCPFGKPANSMAMNLEWITVDFYNKNCEGCPHRRPTGQLPNFQLESPIARLGNIQVNELTEFSAPRPHAPIPWCPDPSRR
jgi:hypothetical protein